MNVLFLVSDDMRPEIGAYGGTDFPNYIQPNIRTPALDKLAEDSLLLKSAYAQQVTFTLYVSNFMFFFDYGCFIWPFISVCYILVIM